MQDFAKAALFAEHPIDLGTRCTVFMNSRVKQAQKEGAEVELISDGQVIRPDIAGIMGAFGAALIARERYDGETPSTMLSFDEIVNLTFETSIRGCGKCNNNCRLTVNHFSGGREYISGNRCERGLGQEIKKNDIPNLSPRRQLSAEPSGSRAC